MATCASCGRENPAGFAFCGGCGSALAATPPPCSSCGFVNAAGQHFCGRCGTALADRPSAAPLTDERERKLATVLFADVVGFTALAETSDPESLAATVDAALRRMADVVIDHGGTIDKYLGDALMAVFGVPSAHEDDAARAVAAALRIRDVGGELRFTIGINSGDVMVTPVGDGGSVTVIGDAVNVAQRLQSTAAAGEILIGPVTAELVGDRFALRAREPALLKGRSAPVAVFEVTGEARAAYADAASMPPFVGREDDLAFLLARWESVVRTARAQILVVTGDAGVGKTRLLHELATRLDGAAHIAVAECPGYGALVSSRLAIELERQLGLDGDADTAGALDDAGAWRVRRRVAELTAQRPLVVIVDDAHNAAPADIEPLQQLTTRLGDAPVLILLCGRVQPGAWLERLAGTTTLRVEPLAAADCERLTAMLAGDIAPESLTALAAQARGNPLHLRELVRLLRATGRVATFDGDGGADGRLPATLQAVLAARLDALPGPEKTSLQDVAVFSDGASAAELEALAEQPVQDRLSRLTGAGLLREVDGRYEVSDPLLREVAYEQLSHAARAERHRRAAGVAATAVGRARHLGLAARYRPDDEALCAEAATALARAGVELLAVGRFRDGSRLMHRALELGHQEPRSILRLAQAMTDAGPGGDQATSLLDRIEPGADAGLAAEVLQVRGNALRATDLSESVALLGQAAEAWERLDNESQRAWAICNRGMSLFDMGRIADAAHDHEAALEMFARLGDRAGAAAAGQALSLERPDDPRVPDWLAEGLALAEQTGDLAKERNALIPLVWFRFIRSHLGGEADTADTRRDAERLARVAQEMGDVTFETQALCVLAVLDRLAGDDGSAGSRITRAAALIRTLPDGGGHYSGPLVDATEFMVRSATEEAPLRVPVPAATPSPIGAVADILIIETLVLAGRFDEARAHLRGSPLDGFASISPFFQRMLAVVRGCTLILDGSGGEELLEDLVSARDAAARLDARPNAQAASALIAELRCRAGDADGARRDLAAAGPEAGGFAGLLLLRAAACSGNGDAGHALRVRAESLRGPGLIPGEAGRTV